jgi:hypothetical protein
MPVINTSEKYMESPEKDGPNMRKKKLAQLIKSTTHHLYYTRWNQKQMTDNPRLQNLWTFLYSKKIYGDIDVQSSLPSAGEGPG